MMPAEEPDRFSLERFRGREPLAILAIHAVVFACLLAWSWRGWPDPLVDFGRELYVPWQITRGRMLYRDIASLSGPLSPYVNALWFRLFGVSMMTLAWANIVILAATIAGIYHLLRRATDRLTASVATLTALLLFGFTQYDVVGNYNFITPYSHEATHGLAAAVAMLAALDRGLTARSRRWCATAGLCLGLTLLTKPEIGAAAIAGASAGWCAAFAIDRLDRRDLSRRLAMFVAMAFVPPALFFGYFLEAMSSQDALRAALGAWSPLVGTGIVDNAFYRAGMGLDAPLKHLGATLWAFAGFVLFVILAAGMSWSRTKETDRVSAVRRAARIGFLAVTIFVAAVGTLPRALPLIVLTSLVAAVALIARDGGDRDQAVRRLSLLTWSGFALVLLAKMGLNARLYHYGFYLALPATVAAISLVTWTIPRMLAMWDPRIAAQGFRQLALWALAAVVAPYLVFAVGISRTKTAAVGYGGDRFYASNRTTYVDSVRQALGALQGVVHPGETLAVIPEGVMLNYLLRLDSPLRVINLMPPEWLAFGEGDVLHAFATRAPDYVLMVDRDTREYGYPQFGSDARYGRGVVRWVNEHYDSVCTLPGDPGSDAMHMRLMKKRG